METIRGRGYLQLEDCALSPGNFNACYPKIVYILDKKIEALCPVECVWERGTEGRPEPCTPRVIKLLQTACFTVCEN